MHAIITYNKIEIDAPGQSSRSSHFAHSGGSGEARIQLLTTILLQTRTPHSIPVPLFRGTS
eukprot:SAG11_NODE_26550_length_343_cov_12.122951_1_plen_60_part_10